MGIYKEISKDRAKADKEHQEFLKEKGITDKEFKRIVEKIISDRIDESIRMAKKYNYFNS